MKVHRVPALRRRSLGFVVAAGIQAFAVGQTQAAPVTVDLQMKSVGSSSYTTDVVIKNNTTTAINGWTLVFKLGNTIKSFYSVTESGADPYTWKNVSFNGAIAVGATQTFGFTGNGTFNSANLGNCTLNGAACTLLVGGAPIGGASSSAAASSVAASSAATSSVAASSSSSISGTTITSSNGFVNTALANQTGSFTVSFDAKPSISPANNTISLSSGAQTAYTGMAASVRFATTGTIDARNGGAYAAVTSVPFVANGIYHFRMVVNVPAKTYSAYVTPPGGTEKTIATNYAFRTEQAGITNINNFDANVNSSPGGSLTYTTPVISGSSSSSVASSAAASSVAASSRASSAAASSAAASSTAASSAPASSSSSSTGVVRYRQTFDTLATGALWKNNLDSAKPTAHKENALVTASCGTGGSTCLRIVYRHPDGIHKQPFSSPVFATTSGVINWAPSDSTHTNTATDVLQANLPIDGTTDGSSKDSNAAIPAKAYTLAYDVYFEPGFDFAKGGKLPGLAAAAFDSGCTEDGNNKRSGTNWSERIMWRANGRVEMYSYDQSRPSGSCGINKMIDQVAGDPPYEVPGQIPNDGKFRFKSGIWYTVRVSVKMNDNNANVYQKDGSGNLVLDASGDPIVVSGNGEVSLAIKSADGATKRLMVYSNVALRDECNGPCSGTPPDTKATWINGLFFSTFHGGNETKRLTCIDPSSTMTNVVQKAMPSYSGLTQARFNALCASQINVPLFPILTWNPQTNTAARFDNMIITDGYTSAPF
ncbi:MAG: Carbohydrate-binding family [Rhodocyclales bacterium]|nr:Carbohydrate-binding family [Rhodocyclales bacterium]